MANERVALVGTVAMKVIGPDGNLRAEMNGHNRVLRRGRSLVASALAGQVASPTFRIVLGSEGTVTENDDLKEMLKPIPVDAYSEEAEPVLALDPENAQFRLVTTFTARSEMTVAESGIEVTQASPREFPPQPVPMKTASRAVTSTGVASKLAKAALITATALDPVLYNRAVVEPSVSLRAGDRLTVTWTVSFVSA